jgi:hypothetical protein
MNAAITTAADRDRRAPAPSLVDGADALANGAPQPAQYCCSVARASPHWLQNPDPLVSAIG